MARAAAKAPARPPAAPSDEAKKRREELARIKAQVEEKRRQARALQGKERGVLGQMRKSDDALRATRQYIEMLTANEVSLENELAATEQALTAAGGELAARKAHLAEWIRRSWKNGRTGSLEVLFSAESFGDLLKRGYFLSVLVQAEKRLVESVREQREAVEAQKEDIQARQAEIAAVRQEKEGQKRHIQELRGSQQAEVNRIRGQRQSYEAAARELEASAARVQKFLDDFEARRQRAQREGKKDDVEIQLDKNNFGANRGRLPWPAQGEIIGRFGLETDPQWGTQVRNNGLDIKAEDGSPVKAVGDGRVEMNDWLPGYGQSVILNHGQGYYSVYAHLGSDNVQVGDRVTAGQTIGTVGDSGSLKGTCLHFEIRRGREAQDPARWLR